MVKLNIKLILSYLFIAFFIVLLTAFGSNIIFQNEFKKYVMNIQEEKTEKIVNSLTEDYKKYDTFDNVDLEGIGTTALENGLIIKVSNMDNNVLWDAMEHNSGICAQMLAEMAHNMKKYYPNFNGKYTDKNYTLSINGKKIGDVLIGYYGPYYFNENDIAFLKTFNHILFGIAVVSILIAICLGILMSKKISQSLTNIIEATKKIAKGNYKYRINSLSNTKEIIELRDTVNDLALRLDKQEQLRKDLTSDIAHELRTPITTLQSHLEALMDGLWKIDNEKINSLYEEIIRISKIVNDLDKLSFYDNNTITLDKQQFNIKTILLKILNNFDKELNNKNITINIQGEDIKIIADKDKITQVFINLISNAIKYTNNNGKIDICIDLNNKMARVVIKDNGIGISREDLPYIFERFYRADKSRTRSTGGSGIGLSIVKNIIDTHNGEIIIDSELHKGTRVTVLLPL
jgi:signal transduction histidine kinase